MYQYVLFNELNDLNLYLLMKLIAGMVILLCFYLYLRFNVGMIVNFYTILSFMLLEGF